MRVMGMVMIRCQQTGKAISTGIDADRATFLRLPDVESRTYCEHCGVKHVWHKPDSWLAESDDVKPADNPVWSFGPC